MNATVRLERVEIFQCRICKYASICPKSYVDHVTTHLLQCKVILSKLIYQCEKCPQAFVNKGEYLIHKVSHVKWDVHMKHKKIDYNRKNPNTGRFVKRFSCDQCDLKFVLESTLKLHSDIHDPFPYICNCGIGYYKLKDLISHERLVHAKEEIKVPKITYKDDKDLIDEASFEEDSGDDYKIKKLKRKTPKIKLSSNSKMKGSRHNRCQHCSMKCDNRKSLKQHLKESHTDLPYGCYVCCKKFATQQLFDDHSKLFHEFQCTFCKKVFNCKANMVIHLRTHTGEKPFTCPQCNKSFSQNSTLKQHLMRHEGVKQYKCAYCDKTFNSKSNKMRHEHTHTGVKPYVCKHCNKPFTDPSALNRHTRTHTKDFRYFCDVCQKGFTDLSGLKTHKNYKHGKRNLKCDICDRKFFNTYDLQSHEMRHKGDKKYECDACGKKFLSKQYVIWHWRRTHCTRLECVYCNQKFHDEKYLKKHMSTQHALTLYCSKCPKKFHSEKKFRAHKLNCCILKNSQKG